MKNISTFVKTCVKIEFIEQSNCFGHYPFQCFIEEIQGDFQMYSLCLNEKVNTYYLKIKEFLESKPTRLYLSLDFPSGLDITYDFVFILSFENNKWKYFAIPYTDDGKILPKIKKSEQLEKIFSDFKRVVGLE